MNRHDDQKQINHKSNNSGHKSWQPIKVTSTARTVIIIDQSKFQYNEFKL